MAESDNDLNIEYEWRELEVVVQHAAFENSRDENENSESTRILEELQLINMTNTEEIIEHLRLPPTTEDEMERVFFPDMAPRPNFKNLLEEKLHEANFAPWEEKFLKRFLIYAIKERSSTLSTKRILGVLKIIRKMRKLPRGILIMIAEYAGDFEGHTNTVCTAKYNIDCICPAPFGDLYVATERKIYRWSFVKWKLKPIIKKLKQICAKMMCYGGDNQLFVLTEYNSIDKVDLETQKKERLTKFDNLSSPYMIRGSMSYDGAEATVAVLTNWALFVYKNTSKIWLTYYMPDYNPRTIHIFHDKFYSLSQNGCYFLSFEPSIEHLLKNQTNHTEGNVSLETLSELNGMHQLTLLERRFKAKIYAGVNYGFMTRFGEWVRIHKQALTGYVVDTENAQKKDARPFSIIFEEKLSNIKHCWTYEPFANALYKVSGKGGLKIQQIVL